MTVDLHNRNDALIADCAYDSDVLDDDFPGKGINILSSHKKTGIYQKYTDRRVIGRNKIPWVVEQFFVWIKNKQRLRNR